MGAAGMASLAARFTDRTVITYDPRGAERSKRTDGASQTTVEEHADDLHRVISAVGGGPVDLFGSSGGAVNGLALVARHPEQVRTYVAHEPPALLLLPDHEALATAVAIHETYQRSGVGPAMAKFIALASLNGPVPEGYADQPVDPAQFGLPTQDDGSRDDPLVGQNMISCSHYQHDFDALRSASTRIVIGVGAESKDGIAGRAGAAVAERLGIQPVVFPSHHAGFLGGEYGTAGDPDGFAETLHKVLAG